MILFPGGAAASIIAIQMANYVKHKLHNVKRSISCITFGAPFFADHNTQSLCIELDLIKHMHHYVNEGDCVPTILSYSQMVSAFVEDRSSFTSQLPVVRSCTNLLMKLLPPVKAILETVTLCSGGSTDSSLLPQDVLGILLKLTSEVSGHMLGKANYQHIGTCNFYTEAGTMNHVPWSANSEKMITFDRSIQTVIDNALQSIMNLVINHSMEKYVSILERTYPAQKRTFDRAQYPIEMLGKYKPVITGAYLKHTKWEVSEKLVLALEGDFLNNWVPEEFQCDLFADDPSFECGNSPSGVKIKGKPGNPLPPHGIKLRIATVFGTSDSYHLTQDKAKFVVGESPKLADEDAIAVFIERVTKRSLVLSALTNLYPSQLSDDILFQVKRMCQLILPEEKFNNWKKLMNIQSLCESKLQCETNKVKEYNEIIIKSIEGIVTSDWDPSGIMIFEYLKYFFTSFVRATRRVFLKLFNPWVRLQDGYVAMLKHLLKVMLGVVNKDKKYIEKLEKKRRITETDKSGSKPSGGDQSLREEQNQTASIFTDLSAMTDEEKKKYLEGVAMIDEINGKTSYKLLITKIIR